MLCLCGFELYSRWVPLNVYVSLGKKIEPVCFKISTKSRRLEELQNQMHWGK